VTARPPAERVVRYSLSDKEAMCAHRLAAECATEFGSVEDRRFLADASIIAHDLPETVRVVANRFRLDDRRHALVLANNHIGRCVEDTPPHWRDADTSGSRAASFLIMLYAALLGDVIGWASQQGGRLVTDVLPIKGQEESLLSSSSRKTLGWHTEDAFSPSRGDYVGLLCLRNPTGTPTTLSYVNPVEVDPDVLTLLSRPLFHIRPDESHVAPGRVTQGNVALLDGPLDAPVLRIDRDFTAAAADGADAERALRVLIEHLDANLYDLPLRPGDMCFVDNRNVVHGRAQFVPRYDGRDRWLKRVNVVADLRRTRPDRRDSDTRVIG
jgi:hypothetical protein